MTSLLGVGDSLVDTDDVVGAAGIDDLAVRGPADGVDDDLLEGGGELSTTARGLVAALGDLDLALEGLLLDVVDLDALDGGNGDGEELGVEDDGVDGLADNDAVELLAVLEVPEDDLAVLAGRGAHGAVGRDADGVHAAVVASEVEEKLELLEAPDLDETVPASSDADGVGIRGGEGNSADPVGVALFAEAVLLLSKDVPETSGVVAGAREDLTVVAGEGNRENVLVVADETTDGNTLLEVPETEAAIPGSSHRIAAVVGEADVADEVAVAVETTDSMAVALSSAGEVPDKKALVARARNKSVGLLVRDSKAGDGTVVTVESTNVGVGHSRLSITSNNQKG